MSDLDGLTVIAVEQAVAAPYASVKLADAGARVIKVERPEGDFARHYDRHVKGQSAYFVWLNRGKESICLDLKNADDAALLRRLVGSADILVQNLKPGSLAALGFGSAALCAADSRLIACDISGFGEEGPCATLKAYDLVVQAEAGLCSITGNAHGPARVGVSVCDIAAGMTAHAAILQALVARAQSGRGRHIQVSLFDSIADWMTVPFLQFTYGGVVPTRCGVAHPTIAPYGAYACADGREIVISIQNDREWHAFCQHVLLLPEIARQPRFTDVPARVANREALDTIVAAALIRLSESEATARLAGAGIAYGRLNSISDAVLHPHLRHLTVETPAGEVHLIAPAARSGEPAVVGPVPALGEHGRALRKEFSPAD